MTILELATRLKAIYDQHGDLEVMCLTDGDAYEVGGAGVEEVLDHEDYPQSYNMPRGFKFVNIEI